ncbi:hypothetical protein L506_0101 [Bordetella bronchiseptica GA96-01]|nr:hypothetical protein L530_0098 [Bordetella bronchiseptica MO211]KCV27454.1 hypothetical protein L489_0098 [Bordetella bronchiseptica 00-P-2730]KDC24735.1 hypothetical protein L504_0109 [Bordetella bronchiseptica F2]KDC25327.1 hypothetical protein L505_0110 [Bordetella bronchiseptica F4563]KDC35326.1 hypothetical protein L506_0101 [Bordetella bronchiseptica GA96-01]KDC56513.1 hypothetical protein L510_0097 [Bordetella bronchiseptica MBORD591]KDD91123.1 hypothetical protein L531_0098 [Bordet
MAAPPCRKMRPRQFWDQVHVHTPFSRRGMPSAGAKRPCRCASATGCVAISEGIQRSGAAR